MKLNLTNGLLILGGAILLGSLIFGGNSAEKQDTTQLQGLRNEKGNIEL